jgi:two-component sensor histidine kinase
VLLQEIHHRVKNNLQIVSSLINMQAKKLKAPSARTALDECKTRIETIALIHEQLYKSRDYQCISFSDYLRSLARNIARVAGASTERVKMLIESQPITLPVDKAIPFGLILHELITNAFKHAFPQERCGEIRVALHETAEGIELSVADNGVGMSVPPTPTSGSLGMQLIETLVEQIDGTLLATQADGMTFRITCPLEGKQ